MKTKIINILAKIFSRKLKPCIKDIKIYTQRAEDTLLNSLSSRNIKETIVKMRFDMGQKRSVGAEIIDYRKDKP